jgi:ABC-type transport system involved in cytochrome bd biosynthesis fused ATPase/permease subunit
MVFFHVQTPLVYEAVWGAHNLHISGKLAEVRVVRVVPPESLDMVVAEGGGNLSAGQRQLLSLARAVLRQKNVRA